MNQPEIYQYQDYRVFLKDLIQHLSIEDSSFSLEKLAEKSGVASGLFDKFFNESVGLTSTTLGKILPYLGLSGDQRSYLKLLRSLSESETSEERNTALEKLKQFLQNQTLEQADNKTPSLDDHQYMSQWYYVAIREMTSLDGFKLDARWIQEPLHFKVSLEEVEKAIDYLKNRNLIQVKPDGKVIAIDTHLQCSGGMYRLSLAQFHAQMLSLAQESIYKTARQDRKILSHTVAIPQNRVFEAKLILEEAWKKVAELSGTYKNADSVYHVELALFPLTTPEKRRNRYDR